MLYSVTIEPATQTAGLPRERSTLEAPDKDAALAQAEAVYRRAHPGASRLTMYVLRVRGPDE
jgi:hypothetical protein